VLRRHWKSCAVRTQSGLGIPEPIQAGRSRHACDGCAAQKRLCDRSHPCQACTSRAKPCTYRRVAGHGHQQSNEIQDDFEADSLNVLVHDVLPEPVDDGRQPQFLGHQSQVAISSAQMVTAPDADNTMSAEPLLVLSSRFDFFLNFTQARGINDAYNFKKNFSAVSDSLEQGSDNALFSPIADWTYADSLHKETQLYDDPLHNKAAEIGNCFKSVLSSLSNSSDSDSQTVRLSMTTIMEFFSVSNIRRFIDLFWARWYPHCPIVHRPTFFPEKSLPVLVMAMSLLGACTSSLQQDSQQARSLLDVAEEVVFQHIPFSETLQHLSNSAIEKHCRVNILQASYFMCITQKWEGDDIAKQRIRRQRFPTVVAVSGTRNIFPCYTCIFRHMILIIFRP
jgi:hypothetical protein